MMSRTWGALPGTRAVMYRCHVWCSTLLRGTCVMCDTAVTSAPTTLEENALQCAHTYIQNRIAHTIKYTHTHTRIHMHYVTCPYVFAVHGARHTKHVGRLNRYAPSACIGYMQPPHVIYYTRS